MTTNEAIAQNNKIIAEFIGFEPLANWGYLNPKNGQKTDIEDLNFDSDWSWLMEVVEKIESLSKNQNVINWSRQNKNIFDLKLTECKKEAVYNACVEFIKWYNEANK
jgi:hypothetical protein